MTLKFHHNGYVSTDPRNKDAAGVGLQRSADIPDDVDVLIVGAGPAGMITAAQLSVFPSVNTRIIDRNAGRLEVGQADGVQKRSVETFQAFGFAEQIAQEASVVSETTFWKPDPENSHHIKRVSRVSEDLGGVSEFPHLNVNQARVLDYFADYMQQSPTRMAVDHGVEFVDLERQDTGDHPVRVTLRYLDGTDGGRLRTISARYVIGAGGAHSRVRKAIGCRFTGASSNHAWGVMDILAVTDFPDVRTKSAIQSEQHGSILLIPREGGHLFRLYVDLGAVTEENKGRIRKTAVEDTVQRAQRILHPYTLDVRDVAWYSVYEVGHRVCDRFDDVPLDQVGRRQPRVFVMGDASHTHSAKAGQGMNVSMQDGFNLGWKLGHVLTGRAKPSLLATYSAERQLIGQDIIDFDRRWASAMAESPEDFKDQEEFEDAYRRITEFAQGFMTQYRPSLIVGDATYQNLATGYPIGKRFWSAWVCRVPDARVLQLGHQAAADGRWRLYVFADQAAPGAAESRVATLARWLRGDTQSPLVGYTPAVADQNQWFDVKVIYRQDHTAVDLNRVPRVFLPPVGRFAVTDYDNVFSVLPDDDIFQRRGIHADGAMVLVRPDQYVAHVLPLTGTGELGQFLSRFMVRQSD